MASVFVWLAGYIFGLHQKIGSFNAQTLVSERIARGLFGKCRKNRAVHQYAILFKARFLKYAARLNIFVVHRRPNTLYSVLS